MKVVATAGHVDHGKSTLVRALTGTDPDRWDEEKRRGLTIDLGFAFTALDGGLRVGFVDVPGHVKFLENMLAGVGSVRAAVLVVAAREGWMPQSEEHLRILEVLGVRHGFVAVTMADLVDPDTLELALLETTERVEGTFLEQAPVIPCDSVSGRGLVDIRSTLDALVRTMPEEQDRRRPRMWVDRSFAVKGVGTVVTGTLAGGGLATGDEVTIAPLGTRARIRGVQSAHEHATRAAPGARVALNLAGVEHTAVRRGDALVLHDQWQLTDVVDADVTLAGGGSPAARARLKAHVGSGAVGARLRPLDGPRCRIHLDRPLPLAPGDRIVVRDPGPDVTLGGAVVADVCPPRRADDAIGRRGLDRVGVSLAARPVTDRAELGRLAGLGPDEVTEAVADALAHARLVEAGGRLVDAAEAGRLEAEGPRLVAEHRRRHPLEPGIEVTVASQHLGVDPALLRDLASTWPGVEVAGSRLREPGYTPAVDEDPDVARLVGALDAEPFAPPAPEDLGIHADVVRAALRAGVAVDVQGTVMSATAVAEAGARIRSALAERGELTVADVRDVLSSSRRYVMPLLNHLDAQGITTRKGDVRVLGPRARE